MWICAVRQETDPHVLREWIGAHNGIKGDILRHNNSCEPILRAHLEAKLAVLTSRSRPWGGIERELFDLYSGELDPALSDSEWHKTLVALADTAAARAGGGLPVIAGNLEFRPVTDSAGLYPVCCQTFVLGDPAFKRSFTAAAIIVEELVRSHLIPANQVGLRWRIRTEDGRPISKVEGGSLDLACEIAARNAILRLSRDGHVRNGTNVAFCELNLESVGSTATVEHGALGPVSSSTIIDKVEALVRKGARCVLVSATQGGLDERTVDATVPRRTVTRAWNSVFVRQSETILEIIAVREFAATYVAGSPRLMWATILWMLLLWTVSERAWFVVPPCLLLVASLCSPFACRRLRSTKRLLLENGETRSTFTWSRMASVVAQRLRILRESRTLSRHRRFLNRIVRHMAADMALWLAGVLQDTSEHDETSRATADDLLRISCSRAWRRGYFLPAVSLLIVLALLSSPLQFQIAELLPPWTPPAVLGGAASRDFSDRPPDHWRLVSNQDGDCRVFVAEVGVQGEMEVRTDDKLRTQRFLAVSCNNCTVKVASGDQKLKPLKKPVPVFRGQASFAYFGVATANASLSLKLTDSLGHSLACASVELRRD